MIPPQEESKVINWLVLIGVLIAFIIFFIPCALWELYKHLKYWMAVSNFETKGKEIENE